jgi:hypothetical protein
MTALAWMLGAGLVAVAAAFVTLAFLNRKDGRELLAARDLLDGERAEHRKTHGELDVETAAHAVTSDLLRKEKELRASAESQRNEAYRTARDQIVERIQKAKVADANRIVADLLNMPIVVPKLPEGRATAPGPDALLDPFVQPPKPP